MNEASDTNYAGKSFEVFLQGSYGNDTNIYAESDVDVVIRLDDIYHYDASALTAQELAAFNANFTPATYSYANYKAHVIAALEKSFGAANVKPSNNAVKIKASGNRRSADVIIATEFRRYYSSQFGPYTTSTGFASSTLTATGSKIILSSIRRTVRLSTKRPISGSSLWCES
jgi:hypothetical protein